MPYRRVCLPAAIRIAHRTLAEHKVARARGEHHPALPCVLLAPCLEALSGTRSSDSRLHSHRQRSPHLPCLMPSGGERLPPSPPSSEPRLLPCMRYRIPSAACLADTQFVVPPPSQPSLGEVRPTRPPPCTHATHPTAIQTRDADLNVHGARPLMQQLLERVPCAHLASPRTEAKAEAAHARRILGTHGKGVRGEEAQPRISSQRAQTDARSSSLGR